MALVFQLKEQIVAHLFPISGATYNAHAGCLVTCDNERLRLWRIKHAGVGRSMAFLGERPCPDDETEVIGLFSDAEDSLYIGVYTSARENFIDIYPDDLHKKYRLFTLAVMAKEDRIPVKITAAAFNHELQEVVIGTSQGEVLVLSVRSKINPHSKKPVYHLPQRLRIRIHKRSKAKKRKGSPSRPSATLPARNRKGTEGRIPERLEVDNARGLILVFVQARVLIYSAVSGELLMEKTGLVKGKIALSSLLISHGLLGVASSVAEGEQASWFIDVFQIDLNAETFHPISSIVMGSTPLTGIHLSERSSEQQPVLFAVDFQRVLRAWSLKGKEEDRLITYALPPPLGRYAGLDEEDNDIFVSDLVGKSFFCPTPNAKGVQLTLCVGAAISCFFPHEVGLSHTMAQLPADVSFATPTLGTSLQNNADQQASADDTEEEGSLACLHQTPAMIQVLGNKGSVVLSSELPLSKSEVEAYKNEDTEDGTSPSPQVMAFDPQLGYAVVGWDDGRTDVYQTTGPRLKRVLSFHASVRITSVNLFALDGHDPRIRGSEKGGCYGVLSGNVEGQVILWVVGPYGYTKLFDRQAHPSSVMACKSSPAIENGAPSFLLTASIDREIKIWTGLEDKTSSEFDLCMAGYLTVGGSEDSQSKLTCLALISENFVAVGFSSGGLEIWEVPLVQGRRGKGPGGKAGGPAQLRIVKDPVCAAKAHSAAVVNVVVVATYYGSTSQRAKASGERVRSRAMITAGRDATVVRWVMDHKGLVADQCFPVTKVPVAAGVFKTAGHWRIYAIFDDFVTCLETLEHEQLFSRYLRHYKCDQSWQCLHSFTLGKPLSLHGFPELVPIQMIVEVTGRTGFAKTMSVKAKQRILKKNAAVTIPSVTPRMNRQDSSNLPSTRFRQTKMTEQISRAAVVPKGINMVFSAKSSDLNLVAASEEKPEERAGIHTSFGYVYLNKEYKDTLGELKELNETRRLELFEKIEQVNEERRRAKEMDESSPPTSPPKSSPKLDAEAVVEGTKEEPLSGKRKPFNLKKRPGSSGSKKGKRRPMSSSTRKDSPTLAEDGDTIFTIPSVPFKDIDRAPTSNATTPLTQRSKVSVASRKSSHTVASLIDFYPHRQPPPSASRSLRDSFGFGDAIPNALSPLQNELDGVFIHPRTAEDTARSKKSRALETYGSIGSIKSWSKTTGDMARLRAITAHHDRPETDLPKIKSKRALRPKSSGVRSLLKAKSQPLLPRKQFHVDRAVTVGGIPCSVNFGVPKGFYDLQYDQAKKLKLFEGVQVAKKPPSRSKKNRLKKTPANIGIAEVVETEDNIMILDFLPKDRERIISIRSAESAAHGMPSREGETGAVGFPQVLEEGSLESRSSMQSSQTPLSPRSEELWALFLELKQEHEFVTLAILQHWPRVKKEIFSGHLTDFKLKTLFKNAHRGRNRGRLDFGDFVSFVNSFEDVLEQVYAPPTVEAKIEEISFDVAVLLVKSSRRGNAIVVAKEFQKMKKKKWKEMDNRVSLVSSPFGNQSEAAVTAMQMKRGLGFNFRESIEIHDPDEWYPVVFADMRSSTEYHFYFYAEHMDGRDGKPSGMTDTAVLQSRMTAVTQKEPPEDLNISWDNLDPEGKLTELIAATKEKVVIEHAHKKRIPIPEPPVNFKRHADVLKQENFRSFIEWWTLPGSSERPAFLKRECLFAANHEEVIHEYTRDFLHFKDGDLEIVKKGIEEDAEEILLKTESDDGVWHRWRRFRSWYCGGRYFNRFLRARSRFGSFASIGSLASNSRMSSLAEVNIPEEDGKTVDSNTLGTVNEDEEQNSQNSSRPNSTRSTSILSLPTPSHSRAGSMLSVSTEDSDDYRDPDMRRRTRSNNRTNFLLVLSKRVEQGVAKVQYLVKKARHHGRRDSLTKGSKTLPPTPRTEMAQKKLAEIIGDRELESKRDAVEIADLSLFQDFSLESFDPEEPPPPPPPPKELVPTPLIYFPWSLREEHEKLLELQVAAMDPDILMEAVKDGLEHPGIEDCHGKEEYRSKRWKDFESWYTRELIDEIPESVITSPAEPASLKQDQEKESKDRDSEADSKKIETFLDGEVQKHVARAVSSISESLFPNDGAEEGATNLEENSESQAIKGTKAEEPDKTVLPCSVRRLMLQNEVKRAISDRHLVQIYQEWKEQTYPDLYVAGEDLRDMATISQEIIDHPAETSRFRKWYSKEGGVRRNFLASLVKLTMHARWTTAACMQFYTPKPFVFLVMPDLAEEPKAPYVHRIRFFPSTTPELYTWADVLSWYGPEDLKEDDEILRNAQADVDRAEFEEQEKLEERRRYHLEYRIMKWEDRRSEYLRIIEQELAEDDVPVESGNGLEYVKQRYKYFGDVQHPQDDELADLKYEDGTGLQNEDEIRDEYERAQQEAESLREKRRELHRQIEEEKKRRAEEERLRKEEEERQRRLRETEKARERIKAYLEELKMSRKEEAERKAMEAEEEYQKKLAEEEHAIKLKEAQERLRKQKADQEAEALKRRKLEEIAIKRRMEERERFLMHLEDVESAQVEVEIAEIERRRAEYLKYLEFVYAPIQQRRPSFKDADNETLYWKGPQSYKEKLRRKHIDGYAIPSEEQILEDLETDTFTVTKQSDKFIKMMGLPRKAESRSAKRLGGFKKDELTLVELQRARSYSLLQDDSFDPLLMQPEKFQLTSKRRPQTELARTKPRPVEFTSSPKSTKEATSPVPSLRAQTTSPKTRIRKKQNNLNVNKELSHTEPNVKLKTARKKKKDKAHNYKEHDLPPPFFRSAFGVQGAKKDISAVRPASKDPSQLSKSQSYIKFEAEAEDTTEDNADEKHPKVPDPTPEPTLTDENSKKSLESFGTLSDLPGSGSFGPF